jgi:YjbE family integral membrane protein
VLFDAADITALISVILIDLALAGDNAVAVGLAAAALPREQQRKAIFWGIVMALLLRIFFAGITIQLLAIPGLLLAGGLLLFWVAWRMWDDLRRHQPVMVGDPVAGEKAAEGIAAGGKAPKTFGRALLTIILADVSESPAYPPMVALANVVISSEAASAAAKDAGTVGDWLGRLVASQGLGLSILGPAPCPIARVQRRWRWHILLKGASEEIGRVVRYSAPRAGDLVRSRVVLDRDPTSLL